MRRELRLSQSQEEKKEIQNEDTLSHQEQRSQLTPEEKKDIRNDDTLSHREQYQQINPINVSRPIILKTKLTQQVEHL